MINLSVEKKLNIITTTTNRALSKVMDDLSPQMLQKFTAGKDLSTILESILKESTTNNQQDRELLKLLKNNPTLKELRNTNRTISQLNGELTKLLNSQTEDLSSTLQQKIKTLQSTLEEFEETPKSYKDALSLKDKLQKSGIFFESKIKNLQNQKELFSSDLKSLLLQSKEEITNSSFSNKQELLKGIERLTMQIDYYQLLSHLSNSSALYIPYSWSELEDGSIRLSKQDKKAFFCDIDLQLKGYGELKLRVGLFQENQLTINISTDSKELESLLRENLKSLKKHLRDIGITTQEVRFVNSAKEKQSYLDNLGIMNMGFEVKA